MPVLALSFLFGTLLMQVLPQLIPIKHMFLILVVSFIMTLIFRKKSRTFYYFLICLVTFVFGSLLATITATNLLDNRLSKELERKEILVQGYVKDLPVNLDGSSRFILQIDKAFLPSSENTFDKPTELKGKIRLGWYRNAPDIKAGENWQLKVRLKKPSGFLNPGGFDYEKWLFTQRIIATGYVRKQTYNENIKLSEASWWSVNNLRQKIHETLQQSLENKSASAVISALLVADRSNLDEEQWELLQQTGTSHLIAISGLHIAIVAGFGFLPILLIWRTFPTLHERMPIPVAGGIMGIVFAIIYSLLAGFTLPTQRALLMVLIGLVALILRRNYSSFTILSIAMIAVLLLDPLAGMTISFWLSFIAVGLILIFLQRQLLKPNHNLIKLQIVLSLAMLPLTLLFFNTASLSSPIANLIAIPWVSFIVVPISLIALIFMPLSSFISNGLLSISALAIDLLFTLLDFLSGLSLNQFTFSGIPSDFLMVAFVGLIVFLLPRGFPARWLGIIAFLPALLFQVERPSGGEFEFTLLDAGQSMASVIKTENHTLVYDVGTRMSDSFDLGKLVVVPYLKDNRISLVDILVLSHDDIDHKGGAEEVIESINVNRILGGHRTQLNNQKVEACITGMNWKWDGVDFEVLSPSVELQAEVNNKQVSDNNLSCVIRVSNRVHSLLLTGDIEKDVEAELVDQASEKLKSTVMSVPHHGSKTSSTVDFITAVSPRLALVPSGYLNRFGHPKQTVLDRYDQLGIQVMDSVNSGAITIQFPKTGDISVESYRATNQGFWSR